jgi:hypothetical protein
MGHRPPATAPIFDSTDSPIDLALPTVGDGVITGTPERQVSDRGALRRLSRLRGVELPVALFNAASPLVPGKGHANMVWASAFACGGDLLLRLAGCQGKDLIAEAQRAALAASPFCSPSARARRRSRCSGCFR